MKKTHINLMLKTIRKFSKENNFKIENLVLDEKLFKINFHYKKEYTNFSFLDACNMLDKLCRYLTENLDADCYNEKLLSDYNDLLNVGITNNSTAITFSNEFIFAW